jgi:uncharacterized protein (DUF983 family)
MSLSAVTTQTSTRDKWLAVRRGFMGRCPNCGEGRLYRAFLKVADNCPACGEELFHHRADDAPPYFTILIVGHVIGTAMLVMEEINADLPTWLHMAIWPPLTVALSLALLPRIKGALVGYQWALEMHGFGGESED